MFKLDIRDKIKLLLISFIIILCFCFYFQNYSYARYTSRKDETSNVSIAKLDVSVEFDNIESTNLVNGNDILDYKIKIKNNSDVSNLYSITLENVPENVYVSLDDSSFKLSTNNKIMFYHVGEFYINNSNNIHEHKLSFKSSIDAKEAIETIKIKVDVEQID